jgi:hypothetical protein
MPVCSKPRYVLFATFVLMVNSAANATVADASPPIAGVNPDARPAGAPVITEVTRTEDWYKQALTGVSRPYPASLHFLENQGNWYIPFIRPGMVGRYDIRNWHK